MSKRVVPGVGSTRISRSLSSESSPVATDPNTRAFLARCTSTMRRTAIR
jgi:hypothetical protein